MSEQRHGYFEAPFGGQFMPETLMNAVIELEEAYNKITKMILISYANLRIYIKIYRPSIPFILCRTHDRGSWGAKIYLKREDLNHTGSHKLNNVIKPKCYWQNGWK